VCSLVCESKAENRKRTDSSVHPSIRPPFSVVFRSLTLSIVDPPLGSSSSASKGRSRWSSERQRNAQYNCPGHPSNQTVFFVSLCVFAFDGHGCFCFVLVGSRFVVVAMGILVWFSTRQQQPRRQQQQPPPPRLLSSFRLLVGCFLLSRGGDGRCLFCFVFPNNNSSNNNNNHNLSQPCDTPRCTSAEQSLH